RLKRDQAETESTAQALFDFMFADMDLNLREMGVGDIGVAHRIKDMAKAFYGRIAAYEAGLAGDAGALDAALARNVYRAVETDPERVAALAAYVRQQADVLAGQATAELLAGKVAFGAVPASDGGSPR
ncbi:MAG: ubiquinol-cytochrome C chaperone family protein, partial [Rhodospirillaceae bacterium]